MHWARAGGTRGFHIARTTLGSIALLSINCPSVPRSEKRKRFWKEPIRRARQRPLHERARAAAILNHLDTIEAAWVLVHGQHPREWDESVRAERKRQAFLRFIHMIQANGLPFLKEWSVQCREHALQIAAHVKDTEIALAAQELMRHRGTMNGYLYAASSLARAIPIPITDRAVKEAVHEKIEMWTTPATRSPRAHGRQLRAFARALFEDCSSRAAVSIAKSKMHVLGEMPPDWQGQPLAPAPSRTACLEKTRVEGGCAAALGQQFGYFKATEHDLYRRVERRTAFGASIGENPYGLDPEEDRPLFKVLPLREVGKVRVATIHEAAHTHMGRALSGETIPLLARHPWFREGLTGQQSTLRAEGTLGVRGNYDPALHTGLYSADWTASTDFIRQGDAQAIMNGIADALHWSNTKRQAALNLVGEQICLTPEGPRVVTTGVLLGLGISWTVLSVFNAFCASSRRGIRFDRSLKICGDDLLGLWRQDRIARYVTRVENHGLRLNLRKSFLAPRLGVFCEDLALATIEDGRPVAKMYPIVGLREAAGTLLLERPSRTGLVGVRDGWYRLLQGEGKITPKPLRALVKARLRDTLPKGALPGPPELGCFGGYPRLRSLQDRRKYANLMSAYLRRGPVANQRGMSDEVWSRFARDLRMCRVSAQPPLPLGNTSSLYPPPTPETGLRAGGGTDVWPVSEAEVRGTFLAAHARLDLFGIKTKPEELRPFERMALANARSRIGSLYLRNGQSLWDSERLRHQINRRGRRLLFRLWHRNISAPTASQIKTLLRILRRTVDIQIDALGAAEVASSSGIRPPTLQSGGTRPWVLGQFIVPYKPPASQGSTAYS
nr:MAG: RNA-dependent RNA polymerase [Sanya narna-like virus 5]